MTGRRFVFHGAEMSTLETIDMAVVDEYTNEQLEILDEENDEAEMLARELFSENGDDDFDDLCVDDYGNIVENTANVEVGESSHVMEYPTDHEWGNYGNEMDDGPAANIPLFYDYPCFDNSCEWLNDPNEYDGFVTSHSKNELFKGQRFVSKDAVIHAVQLYSILNRVEYKVDKSEPCMVNLKCRIDGIGRVQCGWHFRAVKRKSSVMFVCSVYDGPHTCDHDIIPNDNYHLNKDFIGWEIKNIIQERVCISPLLVKEMIQKKYGFDVSYLKAWRGRQKALEILFGDWQKSFDLLPSYMDTLQKVNPGTVVYWQKTEIDGKMYIDRMFWSFGPAIEAFKYCRPVLSVDGTHLYGKYKGTLLIAVGLDANNHVLPLAFALVQSKNNSSWPWFMSCIRRGVTNRDELCVISDRHAGIMYSMSQPEWSPPRAYHRTCVRHFASNFQTRVRKKELKKMLETTAYLNQPRKFLPAFRDLIDLLKSNVDICMWLREQPKERWSLAYDEDGRRWGSMTTNASEVFNAVIRSGGDLPITALVHYCFKQTNHYFVSRRNQYRGHMQEYSPRVEEKIKKLVTKSYCHRVTMYNQATREASVLTGGSNHVHTVHMRNMTCTCRKWQAFHCPCAHALKVGATLRTSKYYGVAYEYKMEAYYNTWAPVFHPMPDKAYWELGPYPTHLPNPWFIRPASRGGLETRRRRNEMDGVGNSRRRTTTPAMRNQKKCGLCHGVGHNRAGCPNRI